MDNNNKIITFFPIYQANNGNRAQQQENTLEYTNLLQDITSMQNNNLESKAMKRLVLILLSLQIQHQIINLAIMQKHSLGRWQKAHSFFIEKYRDFLSLTSFKSFTYMKPFGICY
jgi:hypothetical protein